MNNYILAYYQQIKDGSIIVGRWVLLLYELIIEGLENGSFFYDNKKAHKAIRFIENFCHHSKGRNDLIKLELWQKAFVSLIFGILDADGNRQFREIVLVVGRKNGKSLLASAIMAYELFCGGEHGCDIYIVAPKLDQAEIIYSCFWETVKSEPDLKELIRPRKSDYYVESTNSIVKKIAFNARKSDGLNPQICLIDELASWPAEQGKKQYEVMKSALGARRQPFILATTTAGYVNEGPYDELITRATRFLLGDSKERRLLPLLYMIDDVERWNDINELYKSNPNLGVSVSVSYMLEEIAVAENSISKKNEFLCKYCNIKQNSSSAFFSVKDIEKTLGDEITPQFLAHSYAVGGIDLSQCVDLTAGVCVVEKEGKNYCLAHFWMPANKLQAATARDGLPYAEFVRRGWLSLSGENYVDYDDVFMWFVELVEKYEILPLVIGYDRYSSMYLVKKMQDYGFNMSDCWQGYNMTPAINEIEHLVKDGLFIIGNNDLMKLHMLGVAVQQDNESRRKKIIKISQTEHIDGVAAALDSLIVKLANCEQYGSQLEN